MSKSLRRQLVRNESAAIAPLYGIVLFALVGMAGVGFDYARMMSLQSELQNAADQAALAGATQLDGNPGACDRASLAVTQFAENYTRYAKDGGNADVTFGTPGSACATTANIVFWFDKEKTTLATEKSSTNPDKFANFVEVFAAPRSTTFALTPLIDLFSSGNMTGVALAGLGSAICKVPPVMMCNPAESVDPNFQISNYVGKGIRLVANTNKDPTADEDPGGYGPGVFGYLETDAGNGASATAATLGRTAFAGECVSIDGADVKPGQQVSVLDALNTRFGVYANGIGSVCGSGNAACPPSGNSRIDLIRADDPGKASCAIGPKGWEVGPKPYRPINASANIDPTGIQPMGFPRDKCHALSAGGSCTGGGNARIGDGNWDRNAYYVTNGLGSMPSSWNSYGYPELAGRTVPTRYQQYRWEYDNRSSGKINRTTFNFTNSKGKLEQYEGQGAPLCQPPGLAPGVKPDRRILSIAVMNCSTADNGSPVSASTKNGDILKFVDVFLVEPTASRTDPATGTKYTNNSDLYVEVVGETRVGDGDKGQEVRKDVPYLVE